MELAFGKPMFTRFAHTSFAEMADLLEEAVAVMQARQLRLAGEVRVHTPRIADPLIVVMIDEIAALISYLKDIDLRKRMEAALGLLLSQGAGVGVLVVAAVQDPRKETLPARDLFLSRILLGVTDPAHVNMVLGDGARQSGALADKLSIHAKGVGYVFIEGTTEPVKVRFPYLTDADIKAMAAAYPAPVEPSPPPVTRLYVPAQARRSTDGDRRTQAPLIPTALLGYLGNTNTNGSGALNGHRPPRTDGGEQQ
jgi:S-DNA-T family DNA segregation ATPase FtsK/SpoIIIE